MGIGDWMRVLDTVGGLAQLSGQFRRGASAAPASAGEGGGALGTLEARLAGVVVAALKEAFDRDRARMDLEKAQMEAERQRAEEALRAELRRQAAERALGQLRLVAIMAFIVCVLAVAIGVWLPGMRAVLPRTLLAAGAALAIGAIGCAFAGWQQVSRWSSEPQAQPGAPVTSTLAATAPWLLLASLAMSVSSLLSAL